MNNTNQALPKSGYYSTTQAQFKLDPRHSLKPHYYKNATSAQLGLITQHKSKKQFTQKFTSQMIDLMPKDNYQYKSKRRASPQKNQSQKNLLSHSLDLNRSKCTVSREPSYDAFNNRTSATGFYHKPQVSISVNRIQENNNSIRVLVPQNNLSQIISKYTEQNPITGKGMKDNPKKGIGFVTNKRCSQMDEILYQQRDVYGRKKWFNRQG